MFFPPTELILTDFGWSFHVGLHYTLIYVNICNVIVEHLINRYNSNI